VDPVAFAIEEVKRLKQMVETVRDNPPPVQPSWVPQAGVFANDTDVVYTLDLPGVGRDDVSVSRIGQELIIRGQRKPYEPSGQLHPRVVEQSWGPFERRLPVPPWCVAGNVEASCQNGVLELRLTPNGSQAITEVEVDVR